MNQAAHLNKKSGKKTPATQRKVKQQKLDFDHRKLRRIGHQLKPILTLSEKGITPNLIDELNSRLRDHELIKIKLQINDRMMREELIDQLSQSTTAQLIQKIGKVALFMLPAKQHPKLSNLIKFQNI